mgnify:CR=1 FL=1|tara:strand:- start:280 stop:507 length:228 start_codon:yes stop_codon:yes gene_type:complete
MVEYYIFIENAIEPEIMNYLNDAGYSDRDLDFIVQRVRETSGGIGLTCEFDTTRNAENFVYELELGFDVESVDEL